MHKSIADMILGVLQWTVAVVSVIGTLALFTWIAVLLFKKGK